MYFCYHMFARIYICCCMPNSLYSICFLFPSRRFGAMQCLVFLPQADEAVPPLLSHPFGLRVAQHSQGVRTYFAPREQCSYNSHHIHIENTRVCWRSMYCQTEWEGIVTHTLGCIVSGKARVLNKGIGAGGRLSAVRCVSFLTH